MEPPTAKTVSFSSVNSRTLLDRVTDFGLVEQLGRFLWWPLVAERFFLTTRFCVSSDFCRAHKQSSSDRMAGSLPLFLDSMSLACSPSFSEKIKILAKVGLHWIDQNLIRSSSHAFISLPWIRTASNDKWCSYMKIHGNSSMNLK